MASQDNLWDGQMNQAEEDALIDRARIETYHRHATRIVTRVNTDEAIRFAIRAAVAQERERCAAICDSVNNYDNPMTANDCADAIRRGE